MHYAAPILGLVQTRGLVPSQMTDKLAWPCGSVVCCPALLLTTYLPPSLLSSPQPAHIYHLHSNLGMRTAVGRMKLWTRLTPKMANAARSCPHCMPRSRGEEWGRGTQLTLCGAQITKLYFQLFKVFFCTFFSILINIVVRVAA